MLAPRFEAADFKPIVLDETMLDSNLKTQLKGYLERISQPVEIVASVDDTGKSREMLELLTDIESVSDLIKIDVRRDDAQVKPSFALRQPGTEPRVRFAGLPMGHEFTSLVLALLQTGGYPPRLIPRFSKRSGAWMTTTTSKPSFPSPAKAAPTWFRH